MNAILTSNTKTHIVATTASGKVSSIKSVSRSEADHRIQATELSTRLGWGAYLISGETKSGFAFIPFNAKPSVESLVTLVANCVSQGSGIIYAESLATAVEKLKSLT